MNCRVLSILASLAAAGCMTVRPVLAPTSFIPQRSPELVWVTHESGEVIPIARPSIRGDTLHGHWVGTSEPVTVALPQVRAIYARQPARARTAFFIAGAGALVGFIAWRASQIGGPPSGCVFDPRSGWNCPPEGRRAR